MRAEWLRFNTFEPGDEQISFKEYEDQLAKDTKFLQSLKTRCSETEQGVNVCVQHVVSAVEVEKSEIIEETVQRMKAHHPVENQPGYQASRDPTVADRSENL